MNENLITKIYQFFINPKIESKKIGLKEVFANFSFYYIKQETVLNDEEKTKIIQNIRESKIIIISQRKKLNEENKNFFNIVFEKTVINVDKSSEFVKELFQNNNTSPVCFLQEEKNQNITMKNPKIDLDKNFVKEFTSFCNIIFNSAKNITNNPILKDIIVCISAYLIKKSYLQRNQDRISQFIFDQTKNPTIEEIREDEYVELREIDSGSVFRCALIYHISHGELYALKIQYKIDEECSKLQNREIKNYSKLRHPFLPKFYGKVKGKKAIVIEFINGHTLENIENINLTFVDKLTIVSEMIDIIKYFHDNNLIYRDLKPNNVMIDEYKMIVLIDLDRMISSDTNSELTQDLWSNFLAPEIARGDPPSFKSDIYSLGKMTEYIIGENKLDEYQSISAIIRECYNDNAESRPSISSLIKSIDEILNRELNNLKTNSSLNNSSFQFYLGSIYHKGKYVTRNINKTIYYYSLSANQNNPDALMTLGDIYYEGKYVTRDINRAIHYYSLAANQNISQALFNLGLIYEEGKYVKQDINKAIHYFTLSADQNYPNAQYNLGLIYEKGKIVERNINKAIHYYSLSANQHYPSGQMTLGDIYYEGKYVTRDINKAIHYYSLAANQNISQALFNLGLIYKEGKYVARDINKAIHYYSLAANQNDLDAQFNLGVIYEEGKYVTRDINKAIHYYSLAANQNDLDAQVTLGDIYYKNKYITRDINKAIHYYSLAANQNDLDAQVTLGDIYYKNKYITRDINKAIHYYSLAANQNNLYAQMTLGNIYYEGKYATRDINKAIHYYSLAANQNDIDAQVTLGDIYYKNKYITRDINKAIHYYSLAANQNNLYAQMTLGNIYYEGKYATRDINKAIHCYSLAADQNDPVAQFNLGAIYAEGKYVTRSIKKAIHYYSLAANQNYPDAQFNLGLIYAEGKYVTQDICKAIHYFSLAGNQNNSLVQYKLGLIYCKGKYVTQDINKAIYYFSLASNKNLPQAQFYLGLIYYEGVLVQKDIKKGSYYIMLASKKKFRLANFAHGFLLHEGKCIKKDIENAIHYYKEASSFNIEYAKNNLGIIYRYGYDNIEGRASNAIVYFEEAIRQKNDYLSMYNLAHIYMYDETINGEIDKSIKLLTKSSKKYAFSRVLLIVALIKKYGFNIETIKQKIGKFDKFIKSSLYMICQMMSKFMNKNQYEFLYESYREEVYLYNANFKPVSLSNFQKGGIIVPKYPNAIEITSVFYDGFGRDLL